MSCFMTTFYFLLHFQICCSFLSEINLLAWQQLATLKLRKADLLSPILWINKAFSLRAAKFFRPRALTLFKKKKIAVTLKALYIQTFCPLNNNPY